MIKIMKKLINRALNRAKEEEKKHVLTDEDIKSEEKEFEEESASLKSMITKPLNTKQTKKGKKRVKNENKDKRVKD